MNNGRLNKSQFNFSMMAGEQIVQYKTAKRGDWYEANLGNDVEAYELIEEINTNIHPSQSVMKRLRRLVLDSIFTVHRHADGTKFDEQ